MPVGAVSSTTTSKHVRSCTSSRKAETPSSSLDSSSVPWSDDGEPSEPLLVGRTWEPAIERAPTCGTTSELRSERHRLGCTIARVKLGMHHLSWMVDGELDQVPHLCAAERAHCFLICVRCARCESTYGPSYGHKMPTTTNRKTYKEHEPPNRPKQIKLNASWKWVCYRPPARWGHSVQAGPHLACYAKCTHGAWPACHPMRDVMTWPPSLPHYGHF